MSATASVSTPILALWGVPRSTSTAFEWMMRRRGDFDCYHEPFGEAWYQGEDPLWPRLTDNSVRTPGLTLDAVRERLWAAAERGLVFIKDFPHYIATIWTDDFLANFTHSFLIRDPLKTLVSMHEKWPDFLIGETAFAEQRHLFDRLWELHGEPPPVIDSDDVLERPIEMVAAWCDAVGIPFIESALTWEPGPRDEVSWWDGGSFHENLRNSDGLKPQPRVEVDVSEAPERVWEAYQRVEPHYRHLWQHRITVAP
jgi:hypothetical protein